MEVGNLQRVEEAQRLARKLSVATVMHCSTQSLGELVQQKHEAGRLLDFLCVLVKAQWDVLEQKNRESARKLRSTDNTAITVSDIVARLRQDANVLEGFLADLDGVPH